MSDINEQDERTFEETNDRLHRNLFDRDHWRPKILPVIIEKMRNTEFVRVDEDDPESVLEYELGVSGEEFMDIMYEQAYQEWLEKNRDNDLDLGPGEGKPLRRGADRARQRLLDEYFTKTEDEYDNKK
jgi:hypothetical protein